MDDTRILLRALNECKKPGYSCENCPLDIVADAGLMCWNTVDDFVDELEGSLKTMTIHDVIQWLIAQPNQEKTIDIIIRGLN